MQRATQMTMAEIDRPYAGRRVLVTGHTGFKGTWLCHWLHEAGADVSGLALPPEPGQRSIFADTRLSDRITSRLGDIRDAGIVEAAVAAAKPDIIFHLAAQPLVRRSYREPVATFATNVMGTAHVLDAARRHTSVRAVVCVTTDKVYDNKEWLWGYRENDPLGGKDPYSASKAATEMVARAYQTLFATDDDRVKLATARGGNVVGGGDWSEDRIVVDIVKAVETGQPITLRNPAAIRPWQHVLELCGGYLMLGAALLARRDGMVGGWNFGPNAENEVDVATLTRALVAALGGAKTAVRIEGSALPEAGLLRLDHAKARQQLGWQPVLGFKDTVEWTAAWYRGRAASPERAHALVTEQIADFRRRAASLSAQAS